MVSFEKFNEPYVSLKLAENWPSVKKWSLDYLADQHDVTLQFRLGNHNVSNEIKSVIINASLTQFRAWLSGDNRSESPFKNANTDEKYAYASYIYLKLDDKLSFMEPYCPWKNILKNVKFEDSTFWIGSKGSFTDLHYDTYGVNIVVQIYGRKKWILFSPHETPYLYPSRVPLEESTVFSRINPEYPDYLKYPLFSNARGFEVILNPGDVLFVPRHWWHYVITIDESAASMNMWIDQPYLDVENRISECLTQYIYFSLIDSDFELTDLRKTLIQKNELDLFEDIWSIKLLDKLEILLAAKQNECDCLERPELVREFLWNKLNPFTHTRTQNHEANENSLLIKDILMAFTMPNVINNVKNNLKSIRSQNLQK